MFQLVFMVLFTTRVFGSEQTEDRSLFGNNPNFNGKLISGANQVFNSFGILECNGLEGVTRGTFLHQIFGEHNSLGNTLCGPTCQGQCIPFGNIAQGPSSLSHAFGCQCPLNRCGPQGPIVDPLVDPNYRIVCERDQTCSCGGIGGGYEQIGNPLVNGQQGYLCRWIDTSSNEPITFGNVGNQGFNNQGYQQGSQYRSLPAQLPISWCSCCPSNHFQY